MSRRTSTSSGTIVTALLVLTFWVAAMLVPSPIQKEPLRVAVGMWPAAEPWILAREAGDLSSVDINLVELNWNSAAMRAVGNRVVDAAVLSLDEVVRQIHQGYPLKIVMITDISRGADLLLTRPGLNTIAELKGTRIGYEPRTSGAWLLSRALENANLKFSEVQQVPLNPAEVDEVFATLNLDGVVLSEPWRQRIQALNLNLVYDSSRPGSEIVRVLAVHPEALEQHRESLVSLIKAHVKWMPRLDKGGEPELLKPILRRESITAEVFQSILDRIDIVDLARNRQLLRREDAWLGDIFIKIQKGLVEDTVAAKLIDPSEVFDPSLLEELP